MATLEKWVRVNRNLQTIYQDIIILQRNPSHPVQFKKKTFWSTTKKRQNKNSSYFFLFIRDRVGGVNIDDRNYLSTFFDHIPWQYILLIDINFIWLKYNVKSILPSEVI